MFNNLLNYPKIMDRNELEKRLENEDIFSYINALVYDLKRKTGGALIHKQKSVIHAFNPETELIKHRYKLKEMTFSNIKTLNYEIYSRILNHTEDVLKYFDVKI
jgi:hypothetical protein